MPTIYRLHQLWTHVRRYAALQLRHLYACYHLHLFGDNFGKTEWTVGEWKVSAAFTRHLCFSLSTMRHWYRKLCVILNWGKGVSISHPATVTAIPVIYSVYFREMLIGTSFCRTRTNSTALILLTLLGLILTLIGAGLCYTVVEEQIVCVIVEATEFTLCFTRPRPLLGSCCFPRTMFIFSFAGLTSGGLYYFCQSNRVLMQQFFGRP